MNLQIEYLSIDELTPYEKNARKHADKDVSVIANSIKEFGFDDPIGIWSEKNVIVEGHGRLEAAKRLGIKEVPVIRLDHLTDEQRKAYALTHNKSAELSEWDLDILDFELGDITDIDMSTFGFDLSDIEDSNEIIEDEFDDTPPEEPTTKNGEIWVLGAHRLMCGDATNPDSVRDLMGGVRQTCT